MLKIVNIVWAAGNEGYHIDRALQNFDEQDVLAALAEQVQQTGMAVTYTDSMRRAVEIVEYHRQVQRGATVCRSAHQQLQKQAGQGGMVKSV
jgi:hypothetical protein